MIHLNQVKTALLMAALSALLLAAGHALAGGSGLVAAVVLSIAINSGAYWFSDRIVMKIHAAQEMRLDHEPGLFSIVRDLSRRAGVSVPRLYLLDDSAPNAFATGRDPNHGAIALTTGLIRSLSRDELAAVIAHEIAHIQRRDTLVMAVTATFAGAIGFLAYFAFWTRHAHGRNVQSENGVASKFAWLVLAPISATIIQATISRQQELLADETGARLIGNPLLLAAALAKIEAGSFIGQLRYVTAATAPLFVRNPFAGEQGTLRLFNTHPSTALRIERLESMALRRVAQEL